MGIYGRLQMRLFFSGRFPVLYGRGLKLRHMANMVLHEILAEWTFNNFETIL